MSYPTGRSDTMTEDWEIRIDETDLNRILAKSGHEPSRSELFERRNYRL
jgi:hypothetical protein